MDVGDTVSLRVTTAGGVTEVVGIVLSRSPAALVLRRRDGSVAEVDVATIAAGRVVPPGPARRIGAAELDAIAAAGWRALETEPLGQWLRRASGGFTARANSTLAIGGPGLPLDDALDAVESWYAGRSLPARIQVSDHSDLAARLEARGWIGTGANDVMTAEIAHVLRPLAGEPEPPIDVSTAPDATWLAGYRTATGPLPAAALQVLTNHPRVAFLSLGADAIARVAVDGRWAGLFAVEVAPLARRQGLGRAISAAALRWAAANGARHAYLQVAAGNDGARALYDGLGFAVHHHYTHWVAPSNKWGPGE